MLNRLLKSLYYTVNIRQDDVILASFPKSGNTWMAFLLANLQKEIHQLREDVNFFTIQYYIPETAFPLGRIPARKSDWIRIVKTHERLSKNFRRVLWLVRDPRAVMQSYFKYCQGMELIDRGMGFRQFVESSEFGIEAWVKHTRSYAKRAIHNRGIRLIRYEELLVDPVPKLQEISTLLGHDPKGIDLGTIVQRCNREAMRHLEETTRRSGFQSSSSYEFVGKSRKVEITPDIEELILAEASDLMTDLGYLDGP